MTSIEAVEEYMKKNADFCWCCWGGDLVKIVGMLEQGTYSEQIHEGLYSACHQGRFKIVQVLLPYVDQIDIDCLETACDINKVGNVTNMDFIQTVKLLLKHTKFDITKMDDDYIPEIKSLLDQHRFALDGPEYNKNIL